MVLECELLYLLDTNVLVDANRDYYPLERVPEFWAWMAEMGERGRVKIPLEMYEEIREGQDSLTDWAKQDKIKQALLLDEEAEVPSVSTVINTGYASDLTDVEVIKLGHDPFLVAYALKAVTERVVVTMEVSKPSRQRANRHLPDVCRQFQIRSCNTFQFIRELDFKTNWRG